MLKVSLSKIFVSLGVIVKEDVFSNVSPSLHLIMTLEFYKVNLFDEFYAVVTVGSVYNNEQLIDDNCVMASLLLSIYGARELE